MDAILLQVPDAATLLGISRARLYGLIADGTIPAVKISGCRRIRTTDLRDYVARLSVGEPTAMESRRVYGFDTLPLW